MRGLFGDFNRRTELFLKSWTKSGLYLRMLLSVTSSFFPGQYMLYPLISFFRCFRLLLVSSMLSLSFSSLYIALPLFTRNIPMPSNVAFWILYLNWWYYHLPSWKLRIYPWLPSPMKPSLISRQSQTLLPLYHFVVRFFLCSFLSLFIYFWLHWVFVIESLLLRVGFL